MPELRLREVRLPELSLPEMSRDDIVRVIGDVRRDIELPEVELPTVDVRRIDLSKIDVTEALRAAAQVVGLVRRPRSRLPIVVAGAIAIAAVGFALVMSPAVKPRLTEAARRWRERLEARRADGFDGDSTTGWSVAIPVEPAALGDVDPASANPVRASTSADEVTPV